ncbi:hypothetical protein BU17DRAFT_95687 [Hysterangium stoloniferum]|nr:hypothetical protein BU17DRAFT_95687 [Hysterangium stoloniferum]
MTKYNAGDKVEYRPVGGAADNVSHSEGEIVEIIGSGENTRYAIKNNKTDKVTHYQEMNIVKKK